MFQVQKAHESNCNRVCRSWAQSHPNPARFGWRTCEDMAHGLTLITISMRGVSKYYPTSHLLSNVRLKSKSNKRKPQIFSPNSKHI